VRYNNRALSTEALTWAVKAYNAAREQQVGKRLAHGVWPRLFAEFQQEWDAEGDKLLLAAAGDSKRACAMFRDRVSQTNRERVSQTNR
jgi:hypothetical protein